MVIQTLIKAYMESIKCSIGIASKHIKLKYLKFGSYDLLGSSKCCKI